MDNDGIEPLRHPPYYFYANRFTVCRRERRPLAGPEGFEPSQLVLEASVLPLHYGPEYCPNVMWLMLDILQLH